MTDTSIKPGRAKDFGPKDADESIDKLIERRAEEAQERERVEEAWATSAMRHDLGARAQLREAWAEHYRRLVAVHEQLAESNRNRLAELIDNTGRRTNA